MNMMFTKEECLGEYGDQVEAALAMYARNIKTTRPESKDCVQERRYYDSTLVASDLFDWFWSFGVVETVADVEVNEANSFAVISGKLVVPFEVVNAGEDGLHLYCWYPSAD